MDQMVISHEFCGDCRVDGLVNGHICAHIVGGLSGLSGFFLLLLHAGGKALFIHLEGPFLQDLLCKIQREAVGIIKLEGVCAGKGIRAALSHLLFHIGKDGKALVDGLIELVLFLCKDLKDHHLLLLQLRISVFG